jgi:hypothetical protein
MNAGKQVSGSLEGWPVVDLKPVNDGNEEVWA